MLFYGNHSAQSLQWCYFMVITQPSLYSDVILWWSLSPVSTVMLFYGNHSAQSLQWCYFMVITPPNLYSDVILWWSLSPVSTVMLLWKLLALFLRNTSIELGFNGFLIHAASETKFFKLYKLYSFIASSLIPDLKAPERMKLSNLPM